jgi:hypothetical protein
MPSSVRRMASPILIPELAALDQVVAISHIRADRLSLDFWPQMNDILVKFSFHRIEAVVRLFSLLLVNLDLDHTTFSSMTLKKADTQPDAPPKDCSNHEERHMDRPVGTCTKTRTTCASNFPIQDGNTLF